MCIKNEIENLERIEKDEIEKLDKITNEQIEQHKNFLTKITEEHKKFLNKDEYIFKRDEIYDYIKMKREQSNFFTAGPPKNTNKYQNDIKINVFFHTYNSELNNEITPSIVIKCSLNDKISQLIEKYNEKIGNISQNKKFIYNNNILSPDLTLKEENLKNCCLIKVINA